MKLRAHLWSRPREEVRESLVLPTGEVFVHLRPRPATEGEEIVNDDGALACQLGDDAVVLAVADGAGGHRLGGEAAALALRVLAESLSQPSSESLRARVVDGFEAAAAAVRSLGPEAVTTLSVAAVEDGQVRSFHAGDSPILHFGQRGRLKSQTMDHTPVGLGIEGGWLGEDEAHEHPERHLVTNVLGMEDLRIEMGPARAIAPRDTLVLASDGLSDNVSIEELIDRLRAGPLERQATALARLAARRMEGGDPDFAGKPDDLTLIVFRPRARR